MWFDQYVCSSILRSSLLLVWLKPGAVSVSMWALAIGTLVLWGDRIRHSLMPIASASDPGPTSLSRERQNLLETLRRSDRIIGVSALGLLVLIHSGAWWGVSLLLTNIGLFVLGAAIAWQGLQLSQRWRFWLGLLTLTIHILTRFFEYETGLLTKSLVLVICGVAVILAGLKFEQVRQS